MEELVRYLISSVIDGDNFEVAVEEVKPKLAIIRVTTDEETVGKIIGRNGKTISSIRTIIRSASFKTGKKYVLKINE